MGMIRKCRPEALPHYTIQGKGDDRQRLEQLAFYLGLKDHVTFLDKLEKREDLETLYRNSDLFVMPSRFGCWDGRWRGEGFGIVYVEAAALGVPSLAYQCGGVTDIIESNLNGVLVQPDNIEGLSKALLDLHDQREKLASLGTKAKELALLKFSPDAIRKELEEVLSSSQSVTEVRPSPDSIDVTNILDPIS
jgi:glycosyltransferase involved in cell wall biosynthesis